MIDSHHHLWPESAIPAQAWRPAEDAALRRAFDADEFRELRGAAGVSGSVLMQSVDDDQENERLLAYARRDEGIAGIVVWLPLREPARARPLLDAVLARADAMGLRPQLAGVRCLIGHDDLGGLLEEESLRLFRELAAQDLAWDVVPITAQQRDAVAALGRAVPDLRIVIDHLAAPPTDGDWEPWSTALRSLAGVERTAVKLSIGVAVLAALERWDRGFAAEAFGRALDAFGPERAMIASNWPVVELRAPYATAWQDQVDVLRGTLDGGDLERVLGGTAVEWYRLDGVAR